MANIKTIPLDREMAHVILSAFGVASFEGVSSLNAKGKFVKDKLNREEFAQAEVNVLKVLNAVYPDVVSQYFDVKKNV